MSDEETAASGPGSRWWLNPSLARLAFGGKTRQDDDPAPPSIGSAIEQSLQRSATVGLDLDDPAQCEFGDYELRELIGQGGMGVVYRAHQRSLDREVALKLLTAGQWAPEELIDSLRREAHHAAVLHHPNIVVVHGMGEHDGLVYYTMVLVPGHSLSQRLHDNGALSPATAARLLRAVAEAAHYAHRLGVLHLDLKPGNILIDEAGQPQIADFGLARGLEQALDYQQIAGTPSYMAPEQARTDGPSLGPATDIWALGAVLYEMLTGQAQFDTGDPLATLELIQDGRVRKPSRLGPVPADLEAICLKCLRKDPEQRYASARALADDLGRFLDGRSVSVRPLNTPERIWRWCKREPKLAGMLVVAMLALTTALDSALVQRKHAEASARTANGNAWNARHDAGWRLFEDGLGYGALPLLATNLVEQEAAGDRDAVARERLRLGIAQLAMPALLDAVSIGAPVGAVALSADGHWLAVGMPPDSVALYDTASLRQRWRVQLQADASNVENYPLLRLAFAPDGQSLVVSRQWNQEPARPGTFQDSHRLTLTDAQQAPVPDSAAFGSEHAASDGLNPVQPPARAHDDSAPAFVAQASSPEGRWLALATRDGAVALEDARSGQRRALKPPQGSQVTWMTFAHDGHYVAASSGNGEFDLWRIGGPPDRVYSLKRPQAIQRHQFDCDAQAHCTVLLAEPDRVTLWAFAGGGPAGTGVMRAGEFSQSVSAQGVASAIDVRHRMLATGAPDGMLRLWRLPPEPMRPFRSPNRREMPLQFDGRHLVGVDGHGMQVFGAVDAQPRSPKMVLPQPPEFAALTADGRTLVASSGPRLHVFDWRSGRQRNRPIALGGMPTALLLSPNGRRALVRWLSPRRLPPNLQWVQAFDLDTGRALGPAAEMAFESGSILADGHRVLVNDADGSRVYALRDLTRPLRRFPLPPMRNTFTASALEDSTHGEIVQSMGGSESGLVRWSLAAGEPEPRLKVAVAVTGFAVRPGDGRVAIRATSADPAGKAVTTMVDRDGTRIPVATIKGENRALAQAFSADGRLLAQALQQGVLLIDADSGAALGPALLQPLAPGDAVAQLAFSADGTALVARTLLGHWLFWALTPESRDAALVREEAALLAPAAGTPVEPPGDALRASWRARDRHPSALPARRHEF